jgi:hypothetical protein
VSAGRHCATLPLEELDELELLEELEELDELDELEEELLEELDVELLEEDELLDELELADCVPPQPVLINARQVNKPTNLTFETVEFIVHLFILWLVRNSNLLRCNHATADLTLAQFPPGY